MQQAEQVPAQPPSAFEKLKKKTNEKDEIRAL